MSLKRTTAHEWPCLSPIHVVSACIAAGFGQSVMMAAMVRAGAAFDAPAGGAPMPRIVMSSWGVQKVRRASCSFAASWMSVCFTVVCLGF